MNDKNELKKTLGLIPSLSMVMGVLIGAGIFFKASAVFAETGSPSLGLFAYFLAGVITICAGLTTAELAVAMPKAGGLVEYIRHTYGNVWGFLTGWMQMVIYIPSATAALSLMFATLYVQMMGMPASWTIPVAIFLGLSLVFINYFGGKIGGMLQSATLFIKLIPLFLIVVFGVLYGLGVFPGLGNSQAVEASIKTYNFTNANFITALGGGLLACMFAYDGWIFVGNISAEMKNPKKDLPKAIFFGILLVTLVYLIFNAAFLMVLPVDKIAGNENTPYDICKILFGEMGGNLVVIGILISVYGSLNGLIMGSMRVGKSLADEKMFPAIFGKLNKYAVPVAGGVLQVVIVAIFALTGSADFLSNMVVFSIWLAYMLALIAVFILRKRDPGYNKDYKVPFFPIVPLIAILGGLFILINTLITQPTLAFTGLGVIALGLPVYAYYKYKESKEAK